jgi:hypothetical protein
MTRFATVSLFALLFTGCSISEEDFVDAYGEAYCEWVEGCGKLPEQYGTLQNCLTNRTVYAQATLTPPDCGFSAKKAKTCLDEIGDNESCDINQALPSACTEISDCFGDTGI